MNKTGKNNLAQENERLRKENERLIAERERFRQEVKLLNEKIDWLMKKMFGSSSEALNSNQLDLFAVFPETQAPEPDASLLAKAMIPTKPKIKSPRRERIPENLPVEKVVIDPPEVMAEKLGVRQHFLSYLNLPKQDEKLLKGCGACVVR